ncbi:hypothetical protein AXF42_Ash010540 [Apostasia shenzhenica]|uniref:Uncharacterized protein n=1 Tax=Apostasia shenzhenica TaxID=1088818 RepID=A0A2I0A6D9_9ASPA|nr:hypothetical protein AXF42_Ash010540 [Apostasia shenzhenica]
MDANHAPFRSTNPNHKKMGPCLSSTASSGGAASPNLPPATAKVIAADGTLREYSDAVRAVHVLGGDHPCFFLCDADDLLFDHYIRPLGSNELVEPGRLYFWLPAVKLKYPLTAADMAALVGRASSAITAAGTAFAGVKKRRYWPKKKAVQVTPALPGFLCSII